MPAYSLCCLSSINLSKLVRYPFTDEAYFDFERFDFLIKTGVRFLDNVLDATDYPLEQIEELSKQWRRIGLGITGLADMLLMIKIRYGSEESIAFIDKLGESMATTAYRYSAYLATKKGAFPAWTSKILDQGFLRKLDNKTRRMAMTGLRNVAMLSIAPTGTISFSVGNNCSSGIEPIFALQYERGVLQPDGTRKYTTVYDKGWLDYREHFGTAEKDDYVVTSHEIPMQESIAVQSVFQKWIDHSISRTINIPEETTIQEYKSLFLDAWKAKLKGITSFREGTMEGVLSTKTVEKDRISPKRPEELACDIYTIQVNKQKVVALVGLYDGKPYEIFITDDPDKEIHLKNCTKGVIKKQGRGKYDLLLKDTTIIHDISTVFNHEWGTLGRILSMSLRHNVPIQFIIEQLNKTQLFGTFSKGVARILKKYNNIIVVRKEVCPECGTELKNEGGCVACPSCGWSRCE